MKRKVLLIVLVVFSFSVYGQTEVLGPPPPGYTPLFFCDNDYDEIVTIDLTIIALNSLEGAEPTDYTFSYSYSLSYEESTKIIIEDPTQYTNISNPQNFVFIKKTKFSTGVNEYRTYQINVFPPIELSKPTPIISCDYNDDKIGVFNLLDKNEEILAGHNPDKVYVKYYLSYNDADNDINEIMNVSNFSVFSLQTIYARVYYNEFSVGIDSFDGCYSIIDLDLIVVKDDCKDIEVFMYSDTSPRPGFTYINHLIIKNIGTEVVTSGTVKFTYDPLLTFNDVTNVDSDDNVTLTSDGFTLSFNNLVAGERKEVDISMYVPTSVSLGTKLTNSAIFTGDDYNLHNNAFNLSEIVIGSYDPNDIMESHGPKIQFSEFTETNYLYYTIRFQNVGTADAINVRVENELDLRLDESTFQLLSSSHSNSLHRIGKDLTWTFDDIHLPSEDMDEPASHGYIFYKVKPKAGYAIGDIIPNTAAIYFDFNEPVITNTFQTEFEQALSITKNSLSDLILYPNPAKGFVTIDFNKNYNDTKIIKVFDVQGKMILEKQTQLKTEQINISILPEGLYFVKIKDDNGTTIKKMIVK